MTVIKILVVLSLLALLVYSVKELNRYSDKKYNYEPFNLWNTGAIALAIISYLIAFHVLPDGYNSMDVLSDAIHFKFMEITSDFVVLFAISSIIMIGTYIHLIRKTNVLIASYATILQFFAAIIILILLVLAMSALADKKQRKYHA